MESMGLKSPLKYNCTLLEFSVTEEISTFNVKDSFELADTKLILENSIASDKTSLTSGIPSSAKRNEFPSI